MTAATQAPPDPAWIELQRQSALTALAVAQLALRSGMMTTVAEQLKKVGLHLRAMRWEQGP